MRISGRFVSDRLARLCHAQQYLEQQQPALQIYRDQEVFLCVFAPVLAKLSGEFRMREQVSDLVSAAFH